MFKFFAKKSDIANTHNSMVFVPSSKNADIFRGGIVEFLNKKAELNGIRRVEVLGEKLSEGVYDSSLELPLEQLQQFMALINEKEIKELDFTGCTLKPATGVVIGNAIKTNRYLESLKVTSNHLLKEGMKGILNGLIDNRSLKTFYARSYNVQRYYWSQRELELLSDVVSVNPVIKNIILPDNQVNDFSDLNILSAPYHSITDRELANISGLEVRLSSVPNICKENLDELDQMSKCRFAY